MQAAPSPGAAVLCAVCFGYWMNSSSLFTGPTEYLRANAKQKSLEGNPDTHPRRVQSHTSNF